MDALPNSTLEAAYAAIVAHARQTIASRYALELCSTDSPDYPASQRWREVWSVQLVGDDPVTVLLAIPITFPDSLPSIYLPSATAVAAAGMAHLDFHRQLCTFDTELAIPNPDKPEEIIEAVLSRAHSIWRNRGRVSQDEIADEFKAYWTGANTSEALSLVCPDEKARQITAFRLDPPWRRWIWLFADKAQAARIWLANVCYEGKVSESHALYLPILDLGLPPYPETNGELYKRLRETDPKALDNLLKFLGKHSRPTKVLVSVPSQQGRAVAAWSHPRTLSTVRGKNGFKQVASIPGFRDGHCPPALEIGAIFKDSQLTRADVAEVYPDRLLNRTTGRSSPPFEQPTNVIGCGSVGSFFAEAMARSGLAESMRLIDPETLLPENIHRHYCGMSDIGRDKSIALSEALRKHFPSLRIEPISRNVLELISSEQSALSPCSLQVIAIGNLAVEMRLNQLLLAETIQFPALFVWVEPYLYGGHAVLLRRRDMGCLRCVFDANYRFPYRVVKHPQTHARRESGCQSTYFPYSGTDLSTFAGAVLRFVTKADPAHNHLFSWIGDLEAAKQNGVQIRSIYQTAQPFSTKTRPLPISENCPVCR